MSNSFRGIGSMNASLEQASNKRLQVTETDFDAKDKSNEMLKTLGEAKSAISGKGLIDKVTGNLKKAANKKVKEVAQNVKDRVSKAANDALEKGKKAAADALEKGKSKLAQNIGKRGGTEDSGLQKVANSIRSKMSGPIKGAAEETDAFKTSQAASRGEQIANEMAAARETGDVGLSGSEDALRVGQAAGKAGVPGPPPRSAPGFKDATSSEEEMKAGSQEGKAAAQAAEKEAAACGRKRCGRCSRKTSRPRCRKKSS